MKAKPTKGNVLIYGHRKQDDVRWDISTPQLRAKAFLELFKLLRTTWKVYQNDYWGKTQTEQKLQKALLQKAKQGDAQAAEQLLTMRINYEYEEWRTVHVNSPEGKPKPILFRRGRRPYVKEARPNTEGRIILDLSNGEQVQLSYLPMNTTRDNWENAWVASMYVHDAIEDKAGKDNDHAKKMEELLSHLNFMRLVLHSTKYPSTLRLGASAGHAFRRAISGAEALIDKYGDNPPEKLSLRPVRPTDLQAANDAVSKLVLLLESSIHSTEQLIIGKYPPETIQHDVNRYKRELDEIKEAIQQGAQVEAD